MLIRHLDSSDLDDVVTLYQHPHVSDSPLPDRSSVDSIWHDLVGSPSHRCYGGFVQRNERAGFERHEKQAFVARPIDSLWRARRGFSWSLLPSVGVPR